MAPGVYTGSGNKHLDFGGKDIVLMSAAGPDSTIIDCQFVGRGFTFQNDETSAAVVQGFTIRDGYQAYVNGAAIACRSSSAPTIRDCFFLGCQTYEADGGAVYCSGAASPRLVDCRITGNRADYGGGYGGGVYCRDSTSLTLEGRTISGDWASYAGGGISSYGAASARLLKTIVYGNHAASAPEIFVGSASSMTLECCAVDSTGIGGSGEVQFNRGAGLLGSALLRPGALGECADDRGG